MSTKKELLLLLESTPQECLKAYFPYSSGVYISVEEKVAMH